jgi:hypothetical protein
MVWCGVVSNHCTPLVVGPSDSGLFEIKFRSVDTNVMWMFHFQMLLTKWELIFVQEMIKVGLC